MNSLSFFVTYKYAILLNDGSYVDLPHDAEKLPQFMSADPNNSTVAFKVNALICRFVNYLTIADCLNDNNRIMKILSNVDVHVLVNCILGKFN